METFNSLEDERFERESIEHFTRPWAARRGLESMESHSGAILVNASIDELANALSSISIETKQNVIGNEIKASGGFFLTYQLIGHSWSAVLPDLIYFQQQAEQCLRPGAAAISNIIGRPVINLQVSDTVGCVSYQYFKNGELVEYFSGSEEEDPLTQEHEVDMDAQYYELRPYPEEYEDEPPLIQMVRFWSRDRQLTAQDISNIWRFPDQFLREKDAYDPAIDSRYFLRTYSLEQNKHYLVQNPGQTLVTRQREITAIPDFVRVDYFRFGTEATP